MNKYLTRIGSAKIYKMLERGEIPGGRKIVGRWISQRDLFLVWFYTKGEEGKNDKKLLI